MRTARASAAVLVRRTLILVLSMWSAVSVAQAAQGTTDNARTGDDQSLEAVVVTAQREALREAQEIKMDSMGVVDSVSAEEAGQFPDQNIADALQRVPGVSVNRGGGESNQISIRGFGPQFVTTTVNGRVMATDFEADGRTYMFGVRCAF
jgi:iron complex outermembrane recepter protein